MFISNEHLKKIDARLDSLEMSRKMQRDGLVNQHNTLLKHLKEHKEREGAARQLMAEDVDRAVRSMCEPEKAPTSQDFLTASMIKFAKEVERDLLRANWHTAMCFQPFAKEPVLCYGEVPPATALQVALRQQQGEVAERHVRALEDEIRRLRFTVQEQEVALRDMSKALEARPATRRIDEMVLRSLRETKAANRELKEQVGILESQRAEQERILAVCRNDHHRIRDLTIELNRLGPQVNDLEAARKVAVEALKKEREKTYEQGKTISKMTLENSRLKQEINDAHFCTALPKTCAHVAKRYRP